jgi:hypothetical protein
VWLVYRNIHERTPLPPYFAEVSDNTDIHLRSLVYRLKDDHNLASAAEVAWNAILEIERPAELMIRLFLIQDQSPLIAEAHPMPSINFASRYFEDPLIPLPPSMRRLASKLLLNAAVKSEDGDPIPNYVFQDTDGARKREQEKGGLCDWDDIFYRSGDMEVNIEEGASEGRNST